MKQQFDELEASRKIISDHLAKLEQSVTDEQGRAIAENELQCCATGHRQRTMQPGAPVWGVELHRHHLPDRVSLIAFFWIAGATVHRKTEHTQYRAGIEFDLVLVFLVA